MAKLPEEAAGLLCASRKQILEVGAPLPKLVALSGDR